MFLYYFCLQGFFLKVSLGTKTKERVLVQDAGAFAMMAPERPLHISDLWWLRPICSYIIGL